MCYTYGITHKEALCIRLGVGVAVISLTLDSPYRPITAPIAILIFMAVFHYIRLRAAGRRHIGCVVMAGEMCVVVWLAGKLMSTSRPLTTATVAERLGVSVKTVSQWCREGRFPNAWKPSRRSSWLIPASDLDTFTPPPMGRPRKVTHES